MNTTVQICGVDYPKCEYVKDGELWGIKTQKQTFWVFPVCDEQGREAKSIPPYLPLAIRAVTLEPPDITGRHRKTVAALFKQRREYFKKTTTLSKYLHDHPERGAPLTGQDFERERKRIMSESLGGFRRDPLLRLMVWNRHGTRDVADNSGYMGEVYEDEVSPDGQSRRVMTDGSVAMALALRLQFQRQCSWDDAWAIVTKLKYVMCYGTGAGSQFIYLEAMASSAHRPTKAGGATPPQATTTLHWLVGRVEKLEAKSKKREKEWHQKGGKATSKWRDHRGEAIELAAYIKNAVANYENAKGTKRGAYKQAYRRARDWWRSKYKGTQLETFLDNISDTNLYRLTKIDFRQGRKTKL